MSSTRTFWNSRGSLAADAATALRVVTLLKGVASRGTTVICSLHQPRPRVFNQFDRVILLSKGRVAYSGTPGEAETYFTSIGRPFPPGESTRHPADAMLALCCQEDGRDLPGLFRRSFMYAESIGNHYACGRSQEERLTESRTGSASAVEERANEDVGPTPDGADLAEAAAVEVSEADEQQQQDDPQHPRQVPGNAGQSDAGGFEGTELVRVRGRRRERRKGNPWRGGEYRGGKASVPFVVQVEALSRRLLLRAARHPLLLVLHFGGSVAMALCLASVFGGRLEFTMEGAQNRREGGIRARERAKEKKVKKTKWGYQNEIQSAFISWRNLLFPARTLSRSLERAVRYLFL